MNGNCRHNKKFHEPQIRIPINLTMLQGEQRSVDEGHSPWKLDTVFVAQVFASLLISPGGITGDYPIAYNDIEILNNTGIDAIVRINNEESPARCVYLKKLVRPDETGIWSVVGYDHRN